MHRNACTCYLLRLKNRPWPREACKQRGGTSTSRSQQYVSRAWHTATPAQEGLEATRAAQSGALEQLHHAMVQHGTVEGLVQLCKPHRGHVTAILQAMLETVVLRTALHQPTLKCTEKRAHAIYFV